MSAAATSVLIADDHAMVRSGMVALVSAMDGLTVAGEAADGLEAIAQAKALRPGLMLLDISMPYANGVEVVAEVRTWSPETAIVVVTGLGSLVLVDELLEAGVAAVVSKQADADAVRAAITAALGGERYLSPDLAQRRETAGERPQLTERQLEILLLVARGHSNREIADLLGLSPKTIDVHRTNMMARLGVHSLAQLIGFALREGLIDPSQI